MKNAGGGIFRKVAAVLAAAILVTMLSSCDELTEDLVNNSPTVEDSAEGSEDATFDDNNPEEDGPSDDKPTETPVAGVDFNIEVYKTLEIEDFDSEPMVPFSCGIGLLELLNYQSIMTESTTSKDFNAVYENIIRDPYSHDWVLEDFNRSAIGDISYPHQKRKNVSIVFKDEYFGWEHRIVSTDSNFAMESIDENGNIFLTGFVNGRFENDLGFINNDTIKILKEVAKKYSYNDIVNVVRQEFFCSLYARNNKKNVYLSFTSKRLDAEGQMIPDAEVVTVLNSFMVANDDMSWITKASINYNIADNYFDKELESGKVVDGTIIFDYIAGGYIIPGYIQKDGQAD